MLDILMSTGASNLLANLVNDIYGLSKKQIREKIDKYHLDRAIFNSINQYYSNTYRDLQRVKTFLFDTNTVSFKDVYYPLTVSKVGYFYGDSIKINDKIENLLPDNKKIVIIGSAGSGKSMLTNHLFLSALDRLNLIPFIVQFRKLKSCETIYDYIINKLLNLGDYEDIDVLDGIISTGKFLIIFDGYDEINNEEYKKRFEEIEELTRIYSQNTYVITSRPDKGADQLPLFETYDICDLETRDIFPFINQQCRLIEGGDVLSKQIQEKISMESFISGHNLDYAYFNYFKNPLLLTLFIKTFNRFPELPKSKCDYYRKIFDTLYSTHDSLSKPGGFQHHKHYCESDYIQILCTFSFYTYTDYLTEFDEYDLRDYIEKAIEDEQLDCDPLKVKEDLVSSISIIFKDGDVFSFPHKSLQEYFFSKYITSLTIENKIEFYNAIRYQKLGFDVDNIVTLLFEMDKYCIFKYYLLPEVNQLVEEIDKYGSTPDLIFQSFSHVFEIRLSQETYCFDSSYDSQKRYNSLFNHLKVMTGYNIKDVLHYELEKKYWDYFIFKKEFFKLNETQKILLHQMGIISNFVKSYNALVTCKEIMTKFIYKEEHKFSFYN